MLLDPNTWSKDGTIALAGLGFSDDGHYLAYARSEAGSDWSTWRVMEIATGKVLPDELKWTKFSAGLLDQGRQGLLLQPLRGAEAGAEFQALNFNNKLYYHRARHAAIGRVAGLFSAGASRVAVRRRR